MFSTWHFTKKHDVYRYPNNVLEQLSQDYLKSAMNRARRFPRVPHTLAELHALLQQNPNMVLTLDGQDVIYSATVGPPGHRSSVFISRRSLRFLPHCSEMYGDATYTPTPVNPFGKQTYVLSTMKRHNVGNFKADKTS